MNTTNELNPVKEVTFYREDGQVLAVFHKIAADNQGNRECYTHPGQFGACCPHYAEQLEKAAPAEYKRLKTELLSIGYNLKIKN